MSSAAFVELALKALSCSQKDLASRLGVSSSQITKWKKGEHISFEMQKTFRQITKIGDADPEVVLWCGSLENAIKWERLICFLAEISSYGAETGFDTDPLMDGNDTLVWDTFDTLKEMGVTIPESFPEELNVNYEDIPQEDEFWDLIDNNPFVNIISSIFHALNDVYGFYAAYIDKFMMDDELELSLTPAVNIEPCLMSLAACKISIDQSLASNYKEFRYNTLRDYQEWIVIVKNRVFRAGLPLKAELLDLINHSADDLGHDAEAESLGVNDSRIHPDIYMNELLVGVRMIHQVLPAIMKKLGIDEDFKLDLSDLKRK